VLELERESAAARWLQVTCFAVRSERRDIIGLGALVTDITERKRAEHELRDGLALREQVLAVVSHDLRSPLHVIDATATLLMNDAELDAERSRRLDVIRRSASRMRRLVDDLVTAAKVRLGLFALEIAPVPVAHLVAEAIELSQPIADPLAIGIASDVGSAPSRSPAIADARCRCWST